MNDIKLFTVNIIKPRCFEVAIVNIMNSCASHVAKMHHLKSGQNRPHLCLHGPESLLQMRPLFASYTSGFSHKISIESALGQHSPFY